MIKGPKEQDSFNEFFRTEQLHRADLIAQEFGLTYHCIQTFEEIKSVLAKLRTCKTPTILEVFSDPEVNETEFKRLFK
jgi:2-succinyl-5-enolpyruvyl-6-hydroxy-3-cyclohexene-1-carboxylate synthase